jgi:hypothetical protein
MLGRSTKNTMLSALILAALVKLNLAIEKPIVPAVIFALLGFILGLIFGHPFLSVAIAAAINFAIGLVFFWLLKKTEGESSWWAVLIGGIVVIIGLSFIR